MTGNSVGRSQRQRNMMSSSSNTHQPQPGMMGGDSGMAHHGMMPPQSLPVGQQQQYSNMPPQPMGYNPNNNMMPQQYNMGGSSGGSMPAAGPPPTNLSAPTSQSWVSSPEDAAAHITVRIEYVFTTSILFFSHTRTLSSTRFLILFSIRKAYRNTHRIVWK
jgi:hypothetical protein